MKMTQLLSEQIENLFYKVNWTDVNVQDTIESLTLADSNKKAENSHTIGELLYHIYYFINVISTFLETDVLYGKDAESFDVPNFSNEDEWKEFKTSVIKRAEDFSKLVERLDDSILPQTFVDEKYGTYYSNITGILDHSYYHLGQIALIKRTLEN